jgi:Ca2+-binding EF-hand superfamily protein
MYKGQSAFKKMVSMVIAHKLTFDEIYDLRTVFEKYDSSFDGQISLNEFTEVTCERTGISLDEAEEVFNSIDINRDGYLNYTEFIAAALEARGNIEVEKVAEAFDRLDRDNTGYITEKDLRKILGTDYTHEKIQEFMKEVDVDNDGRISYNEFLLLFKSRKTKEFKQKSRRLLQIDEE